jgi:hypothetical protein
LVLDEREGGTRHDGSGWIFDGDHHLALSARLGKRLERGKGEEGSQHGQDGKDSAYDAGAHELTSCNW